MNENKSLWNELLSQQLPTTPCQYIFILGGSKSGKSTLSKILTQPTLDTDFIKYTESHCSPCPLSYSFVNLNCTQGQEQENAESLETLIHVYEIDLEWIESLRFILDKALESSEDGSNVLLLWCVDASRPWTLTELQTHIQQFGEPLLKTSYPKMNMALVNTRTDVIASMNWTRDQNDFIQQSLRKLCLEYDMSLFYVSVHVPKTIKRFYKWALQNMQMAMDDKDLFDPNYLDMDSIYIPNNGWDSHAKIKALNENMYDVYVSLPEYFESFHGKQDKEIVQDCKTSFEQEEMEFLSRLNQLLSTSTTIVKDSEEEEHLSMEELSPININTCTETVQETSKANNNNEAGKRDLMMNVSQRLAKIKSNDATPSSHPTQQNEVLANFFQSLLAKKSG